MARPVRKGFGFAVSVSALTMASAVHAQTVDPAITSSPQGTPAPTPPAADDSAGAQDGLQEIVVTAQRRSENSQRVPIAIATRSGDSLLASGVDNTQSFAQSVPSLDIHTDTGQTMIFIRGVGTTGKSIDNDVGLYVDGVYIASQAGSLLSLGNIDHVEVLKGPQGTLFGRNTIGGVVQIVTKDPSHDGHVDVSAGYANYDTTTANLYATTGLTDTLATDLAVYFTNQGDGWGRNLTTGQEMFKQRQFNVRNKWVFTPTDQLKFTLAGDYSTLRTQVGLGFHLLPGSLGIDGTTTYAGFYNTKEDGLDLEKAEQGGVSFRADADLGFARAVSITAWRRAVVDFQTDHDATPGPFSYVGPTRVDDKTLTQELQLLSPDNTSRLNWIVGFYYLDDRFDRPFFHIVTNGTRDTNLITALDTTSYAGYGQATYEFFPGTKFTAGLRYTSDTKTMDGRTLSNGTQVAAGSQEAHFSKLTYRLSLQQQFAPSIFGYISYDTGFKSGQFNSTSYASPAVKPEGLDAYQVGLKTELFDHKLRLNLAGFYYDYTNIQILSVQNATNVLLNAAAAHIYGADIDADAQLTRRLRVYAAVSFVHGRYTDFINAPSYVPYAPPAGGNKLVAIDATGFTTVNTPSFTGYASADYTVPVGQGSLVLGVNLSHNSGYYWNVDNRLRQPAYTLLGATVKWKPSSTWDVSLFASNITNARYYSIENAYEDGDVGSPASPRTYGITFGAHF